MQRRLVLVIPAYRPGPDPVDVLRSAGTASFAALYVVDDGSGPDFRAVFEAAAVLPGVRILRHAVNLGKGAALKTGINGALVEFPQLDAIVTADADGQHHPEDIAGVARRSEGAPGALVLGVRSFTGSVPFRSRVGNAITRAAMRLVAGHRLIDTQTGLRAIPRSLAARMLSVQAPGYEFELEMLLAARHLGVDFVEEPIRTIYRPGNPTSHFQPFRDSMRIYFVLLRFSLMSVATALVDNGAFFIFFRLLGRLTPALLLARALAIAFNYATVRRAVFHSDEQHQRALPRYLGLAAANLVLSWALISFLTDVRGLPVIPSKIGVEACLFIANFAVQRDFVFARRAGRETV